MTHEPTTINETPITPGAASARCAVELLSDATLLVYPGGSHALGDTSKDQLNQDLLKFLKS